MRKILLILFGFFVFGCSFMYVDKRPFEETRWTIERAKNFRHNIPAEEKAKIYENLLFQRHFGGDFLTTEIRLKEPVLGVDFPPDYTCHGFADVACYGGRLLAAMSFKYAIEVRKYGEATEITKARLDKTFNMIDTLCNISEIPGLVVRAYRAKDIPYNEKPDAKWYPGRHEYSDLRFRSEASPPQYNGITTGLQICYLIGPDEYKNKIRQNMEDICLYLIAHDYQIIDIDGLPTKVSEFDPKDPLILIGSPYSGYLGLYLIYAALPGGKSPYSVMAGNRAARNLTLLKILRAGAIITENPLIKHEYLRLCQEGYAKRTELAGINFFGIFFAGDDLTKFDEWMCLLWPEWRNVLPDQEYQQYYWNGMERVWAYCKNMKHMANLQYSFLKNQKLPGKINDFLEMLDTYPYPNRRWDIINSNDPNITLYPWAELDKSPEALCMPQSILPLYRREANAYIWCRDPRRLDSEGDGTREFPPIDYLYARYFGEWSECL